MRITALLTLTIAVLTPQIATADDVRQSTIPETFRGSWATEAKACGGDKAIVLSERTYVAPTGNCTVVYVEKTAATKGPIFSARFACSTTSGGPGQKSIVNLLMRSDKDGISVGPGYDSLVPYQRCPGN